MKASLLSVLLCFVVLTSGFAQKAAPASRGNYNLQQQFSSLKYRSSTQIQYNQPYKVVKQASLDAFFNNVQDTLRLRAQSIKNAGKDAAVALEKTKKELAAQKAEVQALQQENARKDQEVEQAQHNIDHLSVLGIDMNKTAYVTLSLLIIVGLLILSGVCLFLYKNSNTVTQEKIKAYEDISEEFKTHKQTAREREIKLKREQQSEANQVEELKQQIADLQKRIKV